MIKMVGKNLLAENIKTEDEIIEVEEKRHN